jgi:hypothetical protein
MRWLIGTLAAVGTAGLLSAADKPDPKAVAGRIDHHVDARLTAVGVQPAPQADDATFLRRTYLLLVGRVAKPAEVHAFLDDKDPDKRAKLVDRLMTTPGYANHFTAVWRGWLVPEAMTNFEVAYLAPSFEGWLRPKMRDNVPYSEWVKELLTVSVKPPQNQNQQQLLGFYDPLGYGATPLAFYYAKQAKPENLAAATARQFLGVALECAQCHNHPFAKWSREQFWGLAAFYGGIQSTQPDQPYFSPLRELFDRRELAVPNTDEVVQATFLDDTEPEWKPKTSSRVTLAEWMTKPGNPFFAKAYVNRMWGYVFGVGIVDPVDDFSDENKPTHPELLEELAKAFEASGYDQRFLLKAIMASKAYQRDSRMTEPGQSDVRLFARFPVQGMTPEQLYDSLATVVIAGAQPNAAFEFQNPSSARRVFLDKFALSGKKTETQTSILQALTLMNGETVAAATGGDGGRLVAAVVELPGLTDDERVEAIYLSALGRRPSEKEKARALEHARSGWLGTKNRRYGDLLWALLNSAEFRTNH